MNLYLLCFIASLILMLIAVGFGRAADVHMLLLVISITVGNGGYHALAHSSNLQEALLASRVLYVSGCFAPMLILLLICGICRVRVPKALSMGMYILQTLIFAGACTIGRLDIFYKSAGFHWDPAGSYLIKVYGPVHTLHVATLFLYTAAGVLVALYSLNRKNVVSRVNVYCLLFADLMAVGVYFIERIIHFNFELMAFSYTLGGYIYLFLLLRIYSFSAAGNKSLIEEELKGSGFIFFGKTMKYMGCNESALEYFPELASWELEKKIPGNGGRFNTFLRQPLLAFAKDPEQEPLSKTWEYKEGTYRCEIKRLRSGGRMRGYVIRIIDITEVVRHEQSA